MNPILLEEGVELVLEIGLAIMKSVRNRETTQVALKRVHSIVEAKLVIDGDVDAAARGKR